MLYYLRWPRCMPQELMETIQRTSLFVQTQVFLKVSDVFFNGVENLDKGKFKGKFVGQLYGYGGNQTGIFR